MSTQRSNRESPYQWVQGREFYVVRDEDEEPQPGETNLGEEYTLPEAPLPEGGGVRVYSIEEIWNEIKRLEDLNEEWDRKRALEKAKRIYVPTSLKRRAYWRSDPRVRKILSSKKEWGQGGVVTVLRGGDIPKSGPVFLTTDKEIASSYGKGVIGKYNINSDKILISASFLYNKITPKWVQDLEELGLELYSDPPQQFLSWIKNKGFAGYASSDGQYIRIEDRELSELKSEKNNLGKSQTCQICSS